MKEFKGKVAVVTGAASGIGFALAERFAAAGMRIVLADVEEEPLARAAQELDAKGAKTLAVRTDVSDPAAVSALAKATLDTFGGVHVVCNNAGVAGDMATIWEQAPEAWQWVLGVNLWGVIHGIRTFMPILLEQGGEGHVVNTASMAGHLSMPFGGPYNASKYAVVAISEAMYFELEMVGSPVGVSVLCPGWVRTRIIDGDRLRPESLKTAHPLSEGQQAIREMARAQIEAGLPPSAVAERVFEAVRDRRFYVFPHPEMLAAVRDRMETILAGRNPNADVAREALSTPPKA
jgi:NAD(P)-dependent dehydrogenase (short-subunit alcohol dehydrogenase family)